MRCVGVVRIHNDFAFRSTAVAMRKAITESKNVCAAKPERQRPKADAKVLTSTVKIAL